MNNEKIQTHSHLLCCEKEERYSTNASANYFLRALCGVASDL